MVISRLNFDEWVHSNMFVSQMGSPKFLGNYISQ
jgi:hypothetical protein